MNRRHFLPVFLLLLACCMPDAGVAKSPPAAGSPLHELDVSAGRWVYHGHFLGGGGTPPGAWTWHEDCRWSANHAFMVCSFSNTWAGRPVDSVVVDTYDRNAKVFWHYEVFDTGRSAGKPFAARMRIEGAERMESWTGTRKGRVVHQRIVYKFASRNKVSVAFQQSRDGAHWKTTAAGTGERIG